MVPGWLEERFYTGQITLSNGGQNRFPFFAKHSPHFAIVHFPPRVQRTSGNELFHSPYNAAFQADLDAMGMRGGFCENILDDAFCQFSGSLVLFLYNHNPHSWFDIGPAYLAHNDNSL